jgi:hypothetical protein
MLDEYSIYKGLDQLKIADRLKQLNPGFTDKRITLTEIDGKTYIDLDYDSLKFWLCSYEQKIPYIIKDMGKLGLKVEYLAGITYKVLI